MFALQKELFRLNGDFHYTRPAFTRLEPLACIGQDESVFNCSVLHNECWTFPWRMYVNRKSSAGFSDSAPVAFLRESKDGKTWNEGRALQFHGIPENAKAFHLSVLPPSLHDLVWRLFAWVFVPEKNCIRYIRFDSSDGLVWKTENFGRPTIYHPMDKFGGGEAGFEGLIPFSLRTGKLSASAEDIFNRRLGLSNDASTVNRLPGGGFEFMGVWLADNPQNGFHQTSWDNAPSLYRIIQRRTSPDGIDWSAPEIIFAPGERDQPKLQFYNIVASDIGKIRIGLLDRYECDRQIIEPELIYSCGRRWERPCRTAWLRLNDEDGEAGIIHPSHNFVEANDCVRLYYTVSMFRHNNASLLVPHPKIRFIRGVEFPRDRYLGLNGSGRIDSPLLIFSTGKITINADIRGEMRCELLDINDYPIPGCTIADAVPLTGSSLSHKLHWRNGAGPVMVAAKLRMEISDGTFFRINLLN